MNTTSIASPSMRPRRPLNTRMVQNFHLVWLDETIDETNNDCHNSIAKLREVVDTVNTFTDVDECIDFITDIKEERTFMVVSEAVNQIIVPIVQEIPQVSAVYILCTCVTCHEKWGTKWPKVKGAYTGITSICKVLKHAAKDCDHNTMSINFVKTADEASKGNLDILDQSFMYTQLFKEILLTIDFEQSHINEFLTYCCEQLDGNNVELKNVEKLRKEYRYHQPIWWYTYNCFLYSMLNRALRLMEVDLIIKMGFFIRDLHNHIATLHSEQYGEQNHSNLFTVYRGQGLSETDFDQLKQTPGGLLSFNNFLSTSVDRVVSLAFAESNQYNPELIGVLFEITINPSMSLSPFANVGNVSYYRAEEEILFSMHSVFRIGEMKQIDGNSRLWQVDLTLTSDNDPQLHALTERMREETYPQVKGWYRLGTLLVKLGQFDRGQKVFDIMLDQTTEQREKANIYHMLGMVKRNQGEYVAAVGFYEKALEISQKTLPAYHPSLATSYNNIGLVYHNMDEYTRTLSYFEKALEIRQKTLPAKHPDLATSYNSIGTVYNNMGEYSKALSYCEKALEIRQKTLPPNHPDLAISYNSIGLVYNNMGEYSKALSYYEKALEIRQKALPANHPSLAISYNSIGLVYYNMDEHTQALSCYKKALEIWQKTLDRNHPHLATSYNNIGSVYRNMGEYSKALSYYKQAHQIQQKILPVNHPSLATSYNNIGEMYYNIGEYSTTLKCYVKALHIRRKTFPENDPSLATSYNMVGMMYKIMGDYSIAFSYYEKSLRIKQKILPANHPDLAISYNSIGGVCASMDDCSKALLYYEKAHKIWRETLPENHPSLATSYDNVGTIYKIMGDYPKAFSYYQKSLKIKQRILPANHSDLAMSYNNIGGMCASMDDYSKALSYYEQALDILQRSLPANHPHLQNVKKSIKSVKMKLKMNCFCYLFLKQVIRR